MRLERAEIDRYGPLADCRPPCGDGLTVVSGPNEAGKTLYLEGVLRLLAPEETGVVEPPPRVEKPPTGRVIVEHGGERFECGDGQSVCDRTAIEPRHLRSVFVVRDTDLALPTEQSYYTSLVEKLGDIHTTEIKELTSALKDRGRLTEKTLKVSSDQQYDGAGDVRDEAVRLAGEIRDYVDRIEAEGLDELERERLQTLRDLERVRDRLATQEDARAAAEHDRLAQELETYREASERLASMAAVYRDDLDEIRQLATKIEQQRTDRDDVERQIEETTAAIERVEEEVTAARERTEKLERRTDAVSATEAALSTYRERESKQVVDDRKRTLSRRVATAGLLGAGLSGAAGAATGSTAALGIGALLLVVGLLSALLAYRTAQTRAAVETAREQVLQAARDAGLSVESIEAVAPAVESYRGDLQAARDTLARTEQELKSHRERLQELEDERAELATAITNREGTLEDRLAEAEVDSIDDFEDAVGTREELEEKRNLASRSLVDRFGEPEATTPEAKANAWERDLERLVADIDLAGVDADEYDEATLESLESDRDELATRLADLEATLEAHDDRLDEFAEAARELTVRPFVGEPLSLDSRTKGGLAALASDLDDVVAAIERDADLSRKAIEVFERIEQQEAQKLTELFDPDGPASATLERVTDGRYTEVRYDPDDGTLRVERQDGRSFAAASLSQGTTDQLYFATRVSLAQQLLGSEPGFLLLDDPFLAADADRLERGFESLLDLAAEGWQIIYLTAKDEVSDGMVDQYGLDHTVMGRLGDVERTSVTDSA